MLKFILLGLVQGLTEFLPVSSSGHLVVLQKILEINQNVVFLDVVLHLGSLCALIVFFRRDIFVLFSGFITAIYDMVFYRRISHVWHYNDKFKLCIYIVVTTVITGFIAVIGKEFFESQFESINTVILGLFFVGIILFLTKNFDYGQRYLRHICLKDSILLGLVQALAIIPGISRSGITISTLIFLNVDRESAFKLSFLVSIPAILGAFVLKLNDIQGTTLDFPLLYLISGFLFAFISGLLALYVLRSILKGKIGFSRFSYYCFLLAITILIFKMHNIF
ncbi:MAG: undecaprenyl-diphosphate phosphatase [Candidatus Omnitrophica bacterium]|nr:undecaprenyl-diphosphate phosphatase [Candidatus Omnitrophota bacterium]MDD5351914.1 undecaprenyl-diphosphate phosphatase [Candidatus Omnitrophota bacterium]MDD5550740.1 undecaprenyl-diphosphate phosphatase [Candidatus Omnitrophota bacterium]